MKRVRQYDAARRVARVQSLDVLKEQSALLDARRETSAASAEVEQSQLHIDAAEMALARVLQDPSFCPLRYGIAGGTLLAAEADRHERQDRLDEAEAAENHQRLQWQRSRDQADWLRQEVRSLRKRVACDADDKRSFHAIDLLLHRRLGR